MEKETRAPLKAHERELTEGLSESDRKKLIRRINALNRKIGLNEYEE